MEKDTKRNMFGIHHSLRTFLVASALSSVVDLLNTTLDGIVVSQSVSADAISVDNEHVAFRVFFHSITR